MFFWYSSKLQIQYGELIDQKFISRWQLRWKSWIKSWQSPTKIHQCCCCTEEYLKTFLNNPHTVRQLGFLKIVFSSIKASRRAMEVLQDLGETLAIDTSRWERARLADCFIVILVTRYTNNYSRHPSSGNIPAFITFTGPTEVHLELLRLSSGGPTLSLRLNDKISIVMGNIWDSRSQSNQVCLFDIMLTVLDKNRSRFVMNVQD